MDSRKEEICSNLIYQSYQGKDSFWSSCLPGWDRWKVGGETTTSTLKFWGLGTLGCKCKGEQLMNLPYIRTLCPCRVGSPWKVQKHSVWESGQHSWKAGSLAWPPLHVILHQHRQQQKEGSNWGPDPVNSTSYDVETIFCLGTFTLPHKITQMNASDFVSRVGTPLICLSPLAAHTFRKLRIRFVF